MFDKAGIKTYVRLYRDILSHHQIVVADADLDNIYSLTVLTFELDDLYDSASHCPDPMDVDRIKTQMMARMPHHHPIGLNAIEMVLQAMEDETHSDLNGSLTHYLNVCGKSIGAQLIAGYLASQNRIEPNIWFSDLITQFNQEVNAIIRLANDYLDVTSDAERMTEEVPQVKAMNFFYCKLGFKNYLYYRYIIHKLRYFLYCAIFQYLNLSSRQSKYLSAIHCAESVLDFGVKAYMIDKKSCREPG